MGQDGSVDRDRRLETAHLSDEQREASVAFATHRTVDGLAAYRDNGKVSFSETREAARAEIVRDYLADREQRPDGSRVAMAHRRVDVRAINDAIRSELHARGALAKVRDSGDLLEREGSAQEQERPKAFTYQTNDGRRDFAEGDRLVFLENDRDLGVKNGMLGTVKAVEADALHVEIDGSVLSPGDGVGLVRIDTNSYQGFDHGYATTIHKNQGATVDRAFVMASATMDRHLTYVAMTRHRDEVQLYGSQDEFNRNGGRLVAHGVAPFEHKAGNRDSYFATLENDRGEKHSTWGVDLGRAMAEAKPEIGDRIGLEHRGSQTVHLPNGTTAERNSWKVAGAGELAYRQMESRLSRSGAKETTLDYTRDFAERRGVAQHFGIRSEIDLAPAPKLVQELVSRADHPAREVQDRSALRAFDEVRPPMQAGPERDPARAVSDHQQAPRRSAFAGLKLGHRGASQPQPSQDRPKTAEERPPQAATPKRSIFAGLKLNAAAREREPPDRSDIPRSPEAWRRPSQFEQAVDRYARAFTAAAKMQDQGLPILASQKLELQGAGRQMEQAQPGSPALMASAARYDPDILKAMRAYTGRERVSHLIAGMEKEKALQADPNVRADRLINRWQELQTERQGLRGWPHDKARGKVEGQMRQVSAQIEKDPQVEAIVRSRAQELGIGNIRQEQTIAREIDRQISRGRSQGLER
ncbi:hypothetical protein LAV84_20680 [Rhizobium sp. VS19-DR104.2]|nr:MULTISPECIES: hypothetical protein [unclassified Rhizobium]MBZ5786263.1 hypothetical protein [Rhizobium sp. VS19-DR121]MBZ5832138.1 hypothetical protein [Rhizobium sp. VS19-DR104.2]QXZ80709.1 hypothetical protein J5274_23315 [Rhizobium sp. L51/94]